MPSRLTGTPATRNQHPAAISENRWFMRNLRTLGPVAQRLEQQTHNLLVLGSNPSRPTICFEEFSADVVENIQLSLK
jgi:hypothetical protein